MFTKISEMSLEFLFGKKHEDRNFWILFFSALLIGIISFFSVDWDHPSRKITPEERERIEKLPWYEMSEVDGGAFSSQY